MKFWLKLLVVLVFIPAGIVALLWHLNRREFFDLDRIEIVLVDAPEKTLHLKPLVEELDKTLERYRGKSLWSLDLDEISSRIEKLNWVEKHSVSRRWPSTLALKLSPYEVKALFMTKSTLVPVIRDGKLLDPVEPMLAPDVAILDGGVFQQKPELRKKAVDMLDEIPPEGAFSRKTISEIRWDGKNGFRLTMTKSGVDVKLGDDHFAIKSARVSQVLDYLNDRGIDAQSLDANLSKKVVVRLQDSSKEFGVE